VKEVDSCYNDYEPTKAGRLISDFVNDNLSNWYVRLNRKRFWGGAIRKISFLLTKRFTLVWKQLPS
jgi:isoleucyl-tRNA synthetase